MVTAMARMRVRVRVRVRVRAWGLTPLHPEPLLMGHASKDTLRGTITTPPETPIASKGTLRGGVATPPETLGSEGSPRHRTGG